MSLLKLSIIYYPLLLWDGIPADLLNNDGSPVVVVDHMRGSETSLYSKRCVEYMLAHINSIIQFTSVKTCYTILGCEIMWLFLPSVPTHVKLPIIPCLR